MSTARAARSGRTGGVLLTRQTACTKWLLNNCQAAAVEGRTVLDFGSGKHCSQRKFLQEAGFYVECYDLPENRTHLHVPKDFLLPKYSIVMMSNVINVQPELQHAIGVLIEGHRLANTLLVFNLPYNPIHWSGYDDSYKDAHESLLLELDNLKWIYEEYPYTTGSVFVVWV